MGSILSMCDSTDSRPTYNEIKAALPNILLNIPEEWNGTTFKNKVLLG
jgi:hypothetical protein